MADVTTWQAALPLLITALVGGYLSGSIPFGLILTQMAGLGDVRSIGSGNIGATNVLRTGNKWLAALTLLLDALKGTVPVLVAAQFDHRAALLAGFGAFCGHCFPVWLRFRGGKGVATAIGVWLTLVPTVAPVVCGVWLLVAAVTRYSSLASLLSVAAAPVAAWHLAGPQFMEVGAAIAALVWVRHHQNIRRLVKGEESRIRLGKGGGGAAG